MPSSFGTRGQIDELVRQLIDCVQYVHGTGSGYIITEGKQWYASESELGDIRRNVKQLQAGKYVAPLPDKTFRDPGVRMWLFF